MQLLQAAERRQGRPPVLTPVLQFAQPGDWRRCARPLHRHLTQCHSTRPRAPSFAAAAEESSSPNLTLPPATKEKEEARKTQDAVQRSCRREDNQQGLGNVHHTYSREKTLNHGGEQRSQRRCAHRSCRWFADEVVEATKDHECGWCTTNADHHLKEPMQSPRNFTDTSQD